MIITKLEGFMQEFYFEDPSPYGLRMTWGLDQSVPSPCHPEEHGDEGSP